MIKTRLPQYILGLFFVLTLPARAAVSLENITPSFIRTPLDSAYIIATTIQNPAEKNPLLGKIAVQYMLSGDPKIAIQIGTQLQKTFPTDAAANLVFPEIGAALAKQNKNTEVKQLLATITDKQTTLEYVSLTYIQERSFELAKSFIKDVESTAKRQRLQLQLAEAYAKELQFDKAISVLQSIPASQFKNNTLLTVALLQAKNQNTDNAQRLLAEITDPLLQAKGLSEIVYYVAEEKEFQEAMRIANSIFIPQERMQALANLAGGYARYRLFTDALAIAETLPAQSEARDKAYSSIAVAFASLGNIESADTMYKEVQNRAETSIALARLAVKQDNYDRAYQLIDRIEDPAMKQKGFLSLGEALGGAEQFHYAQLLLRQIKPTAAKNKALASYIRTFALHASQPRVLRIAQEITDPILRNTALEEIVLRYLKNSQFTDAKQMIAEITDPLKRHSLYIQASEKTKDTPNLASDFLATDMATIPTIQSAYGRALATAEVGVQFAAIKQTARAQEILQAAYNSVKNDRNFFTNTTLITTLAQGFLYIDNPELAYALITRLPQLEDQVMFLLKTPSETETPASEKKRRTALRELARAAQLRTQ